MHSIRKKVILHLTVNATINLTIVIELVLKVALTVYLLSIIAQLCNYNFVDTHHW